VTADRKQEETTDMSSTTGRSPGAASEASLAELIKQLSEQSSRLARQEVELAKSELAYKGKRAGIGAGMFGGAGAFGFYGLGALTAAAILALATAVAAWLAALIIAAVFAAIAGVLALQGKTKVQQATPPVPEEATESVKEDVQWAKTKAQQARQ
jgi:Putative Actinobacterial Holin-X, holin superfamily III